MTDDRQVELETAQSELAIARGWWQEFKAEGSDPGDADAAKRLYLEAGKRLNKARQALKT